MNSLLYSPFISNRLIYISSFIFKDLLGLDFQLTNNMSDYQSFEGLRFNYSNDRVHAKEIWLKPHPLLFEENISQQSIDLFDIQGIAVFFRTQVKAAFPFDILASSFYMLSRYEEYLPFKKDAHQRFSARQSLAFRAGFLEQPIIHQWLDLWIEAIREIYPGFKPKSRVYTFCPTYDIDIPWAFRHRGLRGWARTGIDLIKANWPLLKARYNALKNPESDSFFYFNTLESKHRQYSIQPRVFWLLANGSRYDINPDYRLKEFQDLIKKTDEWSHSGLHPSYLSNQQPQLLGQEKQRLEKILNQPITHSRQHFLRLHLPQTYRQLIIAGIKHDYSMGFADQTGYRAGTSESFMWYDLAKDTATSLSIHPFVAMDVSLKQYEGCTAEQAQQKLQKLQKYCRQNNLTFRTLWHNSSFSSLHGWAGWDEIYWRLFE